MKINNYEVTESVDSEGEICYEYFACTCEESDKEFWESALKEHLPESGVDPVSSLIMELNHYYSAGCGAIMCDLWFGFTIYAGKGEWDKVENKFIYSKQCNVDIQCDEVSHGLLAAIMILEQLGYGEN